MSNTYKYDYLVFIGRFQPLHIGHLKVIQQALSLAKKLIIVIGSADQPRSPKNPFTFVERHNMIFDALLGEAIDTERVYITKVRDCMYNNQKWATDVQQAVSKGTSRGGWHDIIRIGIIGHHKDETSFYLNMFPQWELEEHELDEVLSATDLRVAYFDRMNLKFLQSLVPSTVYHWLQKFRDSNPAFLQLESEHQFIKKYKQAWASSPYEPTFVTVDAVLVCSAHILMVERKAAPGEGLLALPGGFVGYNETLVDAVIREIREETKLKIPSSVLKGSIQKQVVFDHPFRSQRGRTITHAFHIELPAGPLPKVKGGDDAKNAAWISINEIHDKWEQLFEDHGSIISSVIGL